MDPACNIELKAHLADIDAARATAQRLATSYLGFQQQTDTYFHCSQGRLKLREIVDFGTQSEEKNPASRAMRTRTQLISYDREDEIEAKESYYQIVEIANSARVRELKTQMGIRAVVTKRREVYLYHNVRIHLDEVQELGSFLEFEAVLGPGVDRVTGRAQVALLKSEFGIRQDDLLDCSYIDMKLQSAPGQLVAL
jgi:predicted adenylyl cyclase CyaB